MSGEKVSWSEIAAIIRSRRGELRLQQKEAANIGGISVATWRLLESGEKKNFSAATLHAVTVALQWPADAIIQLQLGISAREFSSGNFRSNGLQNTSDESSHESPDDQSFAGLSGVIWDELSHEEKQEVASFVKRIIKIRENNISDRTQ